MAVVVKRPTRRIEFCTDLSLRAEWEQAVARLQEVRGQNRAETEGGNSAVSEAASAVKALEDAMRNETIVFTLSALPRKAWVEFEDAHPAREGNETDKALDIDVSALDGPIRDGIVKVEDLDGNPVDFDAASDWVPLADDMTSGQWSDFALATVQLNRGVKERPFSQLASRLIQA